MVCPHMISLSFSEPERSIETANAAAAVPFQLQRMERKKNASTATKRTANTDMLKICARMERPNTATAGTIHKEAPNGKSAA